MEGRNWICGKTKQEKRKKRQIYQDEGAKIRNAKQCVHIILGNNSLRCPQTGKKQYKTDLYLNILVCSLQSPLHILAPAAVMVAAGAANQTQSSFWGLLP